MSTYSAYVHHPPSRIQGVRALLTRSGLHVPKFPSKVALSSFHMYLVQKLLLINISELCIFINKEMGRASVAVVCYSELYIFVLTATGKLSRQ